MIIAIIINGLVICVICVGCDYLVTPLLARRQINITRADVAKILCLALPVFAYAARGIVGLLEISTLAIIGPAYISLASKPASPINLKGLLNQIWVNIQQGVKRLVGTR